MAFPKVIFAGVVGFFSAGMGVWLFSEYGVIQSSKRESMRLRRASGRLGFHSWHRFVRWTWLAKLVHWKISHKYWLVTLWETV